MNPVEATEMLVVGRIGGPYGVHGWVRINTFTDPPENLLEYSPWWLQAPGRSAVAISVSASDWKKAAALEIRAHQQGYVARLEGVTDRNAAERLQGFWIGVPVSQLQEPNENEFYWRDLIGLEVRDPLGEPLGTVDRLFETGADDVIVVNGPGGEVLIPFNRRFVLSVDLAGRHLVVDWKVD